MEIPLFTLQGAEGVVYLVVALLVGKILVWLASIVMRVWESILPG